MRVLVFVICFALLGAVGLVLCSACVVDSCIVPRCASALRER